MLDGHTQAGKSLAAECIASCSAVGVHSGNCGKINEQWCIVLAVCYVYEVRQKAPVCQAQSKAKMQKQYLLLCIAYLMKLVSNRPTCPRSQAENLYITSGCSSHTIVVLQVPPVERLYRYFWRRKGDVYALLWDMQR